jgi:hypothetical protein
VVSEQYGVQELLEQDSAHQPNHLTLLLLLLLAAACIPTGA